MRKSGKIFIIAMLCVLLVCTAYLWVLFKPYRSMLDFAWVRVGKTTYDQMTWIASGITAVTSFGGVGQYPTRDGKYIIIRYYGPDMVVGDITVTEEAFFPQLPERIW